MVCIVHMQRNLTVCGSVVEAILLLGHQLTYIWAYIARVFVAVKFLQKPLATVISIVRAPKSLEGYSKIGFTSQLRTTTEQQAEALEQGLQAKGLDAKVYVGMRYWYPFIEDAMIKVRG